jgi:SAM-dependent methyltransferase
MSETMLAIGRESIAEQTWANRVAPDLHLGDARTVRLGRKFDAVISLFHVMCYQNTEADALAVMETAKEHLKPGGLFLFDFWYGPGVLADPPERRERILQDDSTHLKRIAEPVHRVNDNIVEVNYTVTLQDKSSGDISQLKERHSMRYWFLPELRFHTEQTGMKILQEGACLALDLPDSKSWSAWMLLRDLSI